MDIGAGEVTSILSVPGGVDSVALLRDAFEPDVRPGLLLGLRGSTVVASMEIPAGPDGGKVSPDGTFVLAAIEAREPDSEDCIVQDENDDSAGGVFVADISRGVGFPRGAAMVPGDAIFAALVAASADAGESAAVLASRAGSPLDIEPESIAVDPTSSFALATLQNNSAVAVIDLEIVRDLDAAGSMSMQEIGVAALADVILLPGGYTDSGGSRLRGAAPDGVAISPGGEFAITANEANRRIPHLFGASVLDLRDGPYAISLAATHCIFDIDPTLLANPVPCPVVAPEDPFPEAAADLPRIDPEEAAIVSVGGRDIAGIALERAGDNDDRGSVLFFDATGIVDGAAPTKIVRHPVGFAPGAQGEYLRATTDGRWFFAATENDDRGSIVRFEVIADE